MKKQGGLLFQAGKVILILLLAVAGFFYLGENCWAADSVVINEIQAYRNSANDDWIELYNLTDKNIDLAVEGYRIEKLVSSEDPSLVIRFGNTSDGSYPGGTIIPAKGFYLIVRDDAGDDLKNKADAIGISSNFTWTGTGYTLYLGTGAISSDTDPDIIDKVGFGDAKYYEGLGSASEIPNNKSIERQPVGQDSNNNSVDFFIQENPSPQNSGAAAAPPLPPAKEPATSPPPSPSQGEGEEEQEPSSAEATEGEEEITETYKLGDVVINELVSDPTDEEVE